MQSTDVAHYPCVLMRHCRRHRLLCRRRRHRQSAPCVVVVETVVVIRLLNAMLKLTCTNR